MTVNQRQLEIDVHLQFDVMFPTAEIVRQLRQFGFIAEGKVRERCETFLDTFDWRLLRQNTCLIESREGRGRQLQWLSSGSGDCRAVADVKATPRFAADLPEGALCDSLRPLLDSRALIPLASRNVRWRAFKLLNRDEKTVLRLVMEDGNVSAPGGQGPEKHMPKVIRLLPVKGYDQPVRQVLHWLRKDLGLSPCRENFPARILRAAGHEPGAYSSKIDLSFDPGMTAFEATRLLLLTLWKAVEANEAGVLEDIDSEFLHDFRVAIRRARSVLSQVKGVFPDARIQPLREAFSWLAGATGPTRDLDVYLLAMPHYEQLIAEDFRPGLAALKDMILCRRAAAFKNLVEVLGGARYRGVKRRWHKFLTMEPSPALQGGNAELPVRALASQRIWRLSRKLLKGGRGITAQSPAVELHELRKLTKKLRYMFEFFKSLYPEKDVAAILKVMKILQQNLGDIQDYEVQADKLAEMAAELEASGAGGKETFMAIGMLTAHLMDLQVKAREDFATVFADFDSRETRRSFRKLFRDGGDGGDEA